MTHDGKRVYGQFEVWSATSPRPEEWGAAREKCSGWMAEHGKDISSQVDPIFGGLPKSKKPARRLVSLN
ncbi:hypothetical protein TUM17580_01760 [Citrobacter farmeri]|nr:hypothetical protein TUM17580_01760 [Citrobacter farmeri]